MLVNLFIEMLLLISPVSGADAIFPEDGLVQSDYFLSVSPGISTDTISITHNILNSNIIDADSVALMVNLPRTSVLLDFNIVTTSKDVFATGLGPLANHIFPNSDAYVWTIKPDKSSSGAIFNPSGNLDLTYRFLMDQANSIELAPHAAILYFPGKMVYAVSDSIIIGNADDFDFEANSPGDSPGQFSAHASPNPFNSSVNISFSGNGIKGHTLDFKVFDILGRTVHSSQTEVESERGEIIWSPDIETATGVYFYRIKVDDYRTDGKLMLLK